jgi:hypothetical protein
MWKASSCHLHCFVIHIASTYWVSHDLVYWLYWEVNFLIRLIESLIKHVHCILFIYVLIISAVLTHGSAGQLAGGSTSIGAHAILCMLCTACFLMFKHWFCCKYQYNKYIFFRHLQFYSCEWLPSTLLFPGPIMMLRRPF